ncbi:MAG: hypothetical protein JXR07_20185, partial [Reichenbachiella sp.]
MKYFFFTSILFVSINTYGQIPLLDVTISSPVCQDETVSITNSSINADNYLWDFCHGDLLDTPTVLESALIAAGILGIDIVQDGNNWHVFATSLNNKLLRLDFGNSLSNIPSVTDLGNPD